MPPPPPGALPSNGRRARREHRYGAHPGGQNPLVGIAPSELALGLSDAAVLVRDQILSAGAPQSLNASLQFSQKRDRLLRLLRSIHVAHALNKVRTPWLGAHRCCAHA